MSFIIVNEETMKACRCRNEQEVMDFLRLCGEPRKQHQARQASFRNLVQYPDPDRLIQRLHDLIDGRNGAAVGCVLLRCVQDNLLTRNPTQAEFCSEFQLTGSWQSIHKYMDDNNLNALSKANRVVIFQV